MNQITFCLEHNLSTLFDMGFLEPSAVGGGGHEGPFISLCYCSELIIEFGTDIKLDVFHTMVTKVYDVTTIM